MRLDGSKAMDFVGNGKAKEATMEKYEMRQTLDAMGQVLNELRSSL